MGKKKDEAVDPKEAQVPKDTLEAPKATKAPSFEVLKTFKDKESRKIYKAGDLWEGSLERILVLQTKGYIGEAHEPGQTE